MFKHNKYVQQVKDTFEKMGLEQQIDQINESQERIQTQRNLFWAFSMLEVTLLASNLMLVILHRDVSMTLLLAFITFILLCRVLYMGSMYRYVNHLMILIHVEQYVHKYYPEVNYKILSQDELTKYVVEVVHHPKYNEMR